MFTYDPLDKRSGDAAVRRGGEVQILRAHVDLARRRLSTLNAARKLDDLSRLRSVGLHKLAGDRAGFWAISVNGPWQIVFRFDAGDAFEVEIVDYH